MTPHERQIDALYQLPPGDFTAARAALAKALTGDAAQRVRGLRKPTAVPWAVNQVYWKARPTYDRLAESGRALRDAQISTLKGRKADLPGTTDSHRRAVSEAVRQAMRFASDAGLKPGADELAHMFEAVSLASTPPADSGRFTQVVALSGFDALAGVTPAKRVSAVASTRASAAPSTERRQAAQELRTRREAEARVRVAEQKLDRARARAQSARQALERAEADVAAAERECDSARRSQGRAVP